MSNTSTFKIVLTSLFAALICVATMLVQIPIPATGGFANLGDGVILMCAFLMNPVNAILAAGLGSMLADILAGYISFAPGTLVIKAGVALIAAAMFNHLGRNRSEGTKMIVMIAASIVAEIFMIFGYFFYEAVCMGIGMSAAGAIIGNVGQGVVAVIVACVVTPVLARSHEVRELMGKTRR